MTVTVVVAPPMEALLLPTPAGELAVLVTPEDGVVRAAGFCSADVLLARTTPDLLARGVRPAPARGPVADAVVAYGDGQLAALDAVPVAQPGERSSSRPGSRCGRYPRAPRPATRGWPPQRGARPPYAPRARPAPAT